MGTKKMIRQWQRGKTGWENSRRRLTKTVMMMMTKSGIRRRLANSRKKISLLGTTRRKDIMTEERDLTRRGAAVNLGGDSKGQMVMPSQSSRERKVAMVRKES